MHKNCFFWGLAVALALTIFVHQRHSMNAQPQPKRAGNTSHQPRFVFERGAYGCFAAQTLIRLADGSDKPIEQLTAEDVVFNPRTHAGMTIKKMIHGPETKPLIHITTLDGELEVTAEHPLAIRAELVPAAGLKAGDEILDRRGGYSRIISIERKSYDTPPIVWNLELASGDDQDDHFVLGGGIVTGDLYLENALKQ